MKEIWKLIEGFENYEVSSMGRVRSLNYKQTEETKILKPGKVKGYLKVDLCKNGKRYTKQVHRLVANAFISNLENKPQVNHIDGNKQNNKVENLEWCTNLENQQHAWETGLHKAIIGKNHYRSKKVLCTTTGESFGCIGDAERKYNINRGNICRCCRGERKSAGKLPTGEKLVWRYAEELKESEEMTLEDVKDFAQMERDYQDLVYEMTHQ